MLITFAPGVDRSVSVQAVVLLDPATGLPYAAGGGDRAAKALLTAAAATGNGAWVATNAGSFSVVASGATTSGAGAAAIVIEGSHDGVTPVYLFTILLTLGAIVTSDGYGSAVPYAYVRARLSAISGTGASINATLGA